MVERAMIRQHQRDGIAEAKARGAYTRRKPAPRADWSCWSVDNVAVPQLATRFHLRRHQHQAIRFQHPVTELNRGGDG
ncbi:hypothetical protein ACGF5S_27350 [Nocardia nova]|uniref:hypothetical protein n=1 Tax=Nocardia nova TaxID=37330 RepID=UPI000CE9E35F|nr:hypothetical protein C5E44_27915 [Nocardia nova]